MSSRHRSQEFALRSTKSQKLLDTNERFVDKLNSSAELALAVKAISPAIGKHQILHIFGRKLSSVKQDKMVGEQKEYRNDRLDNFVQQLTAAQTSLRAYILASLGNHNDASDVLQRTNLALWKNASNFRSGSEFMPWAVTIAKYEILSFCRDRSRDRHVYPEDLAELMLETACHEVADPVDRLEALRHCLSKLPPKHSDLLQLRYYEEKSISQIAEVLRRTENSVKSAFVRIRRTLQKCIQRRLKSPSA